MIKKIYECCDVGTLYFWQSDFFDMAKCTALTPLSLLISWKPSLRIIGFETSYISTLALKSPNNIFLWCLGNWLNGRFGFSPVLCIIRFTLYSGMRIQNNIIPPTSYYYIRHPSTNSSLLTADAIPSCIKILSRVRGSVTNNNGLWIGWLDLLPLLYNYNQL
jgi:hypothetical protein